MPLLDLFYQEYASWILGLGIFVGLELGIGFDQYCVPTLHIHKIAKYGPFLSRKNISDHSMKERQFTSIFIAKENAKWLPQLIIYVLPIKLFKTRIIC